MKARRKPTTLRIGSVSSGTMRSEDLIAAFCNTLDGLRLSKNDRSDVRSIQARWDAQNYEWQDEDIASLMAILDNHCPDYCTFGAHPGDGADYGCWPIEDIDDGDAYRSANIPGEDKQETKDITATANFWLHVNDHGNATLYRRAGNRWIEVWSVV